MWRGEPGPSALLAAADALGGRSREAIVWADKGLELARDLGVENVARHLQMRGLARLDLGDEDGLEDLRDALELSLRLGLGIETGTSYLNYSDALAPYEPLSASFELLERSLEFARRRALAHHEWWTRGAMLWHLYEVGRWDELVRECEEVIRWDQERGGTQIEVGARVSTVAALAQRGSFDEAFRFVAYFLPRAREIADPQTLSPALTAAAFVHASSGQLDEATAFIEEFEALTREKPSFRVQGIVAALGIAAAADQLELAQTLYDGCMHAPPTLAGGAALVTGRAVLAEARGERREAASLYREGLAGWRTWGSVVQEAYALLGLGRCGDGAAMRDGMAIFERLRAVPFTPTARAA